MPPIIPGGKVDPSQLPPYETDPKQRAARDEEERIRQELMAKQEKLRRTLRQWDKLEREARACEMRTEATERSLKKIVGEEVGGVGF